MTDAPILLAKVQMPEKGVFAVRCPHAGFAKGQTVVVNLGYGPDIGTVLGLETYDPAVHGASVPGYQLIRAKTDEDARTAEENAANALVHAIETSKPEHAPVLQKVCTAVQAKIKQDNLTEACSNLGKEQPAKTAAAQESAPKQATAPANTASKAAPAVIDLPDFDSDETAKKSAPASAVQPQQTESWTLQLGAFSMKSNADALVENLKKRKIPCNIVEQAQDSRTLYVVQSGDFVSKEKAIDYGARELSPLNVDFRATLKK